MPAPPLSFSSPLLFLSLFVPLLLAQPPPQSPVPLPPSSPHFSAPLPPPAPVQIPPLPHSAPPPVQIPPPRHSSPTSPLSPPVQTPSPPLRTLPPPHSPATPPPPPPPVQTPSPPPLQYSPTPSASTHSPPPQSTPPLQAPPPSSPAGSSTACKSTLYPKLCRSILKAFGSSPSDPYGYGKFCIKQSLKQAKKLSNVFEDFLKKHSFASLNHAEITALDDCRDLNNLNVDYLESVARDLKSANSSDIELVEKIQAYLSAVATTHYTCYDGLVVTKSIIANALAVPLRDA